MDNFHEEVVKSNSGQVLRKILYYLSWVFIAVSALIAAGNLMSMVNTMSFSLIAVISTVVFGGIAFLLYRNKDRLHTEYEYTLTGSDMDFAAVYGNVRRKHLMALSLKLVEASGRAEGPDFERYNSMQDIKKIDYTLNNESQKVYLFYIKEGAKNLLLLEPSEKLTALLRKYNPRVFNL